MPRKSKVHQLAPELKAEIDRLLTHTPATLDDIIAHLKKLDPDVDISRSSVGRYAANFNDVAAEMRKYKEMAAGFASELGAVEDTEAHTAIVQIMHTLLMRSGMSAIEDGGSMDPKDLMFLGRTVRDLMGSVKDRQALIDTINREITKKAEAAADNAEKIAEEGGLSAERIAQLRREVLGVRAGG